MKKFVKETSKKLATGALAILATIGSSSLGVFADPGPNSPTGTFGGNAVTSESDVGIEGASLTGTIPVKAFQTSKVYNYEFHISWGNMKFIFDRGVYDPAHDVLTKKVNTGAYQYCEATVDDGAGVAGTTAGVGKWCGFDGENNRVDIENLGNGNIRLNVGCTESSAATAPMSSQGVDMQIGVLTDDMGSTADYWALSGTPLNATMRDGEGADSTVPMTFATGSGAAATAIIQKAFDLNGSAALSQGLSNEVKFFLNITGTPTQGASATNLDTLDLSANEYPSTDNGGWEQIGTIDLTFTPMEEDMSVSAGS